MRALSVTGDRGFRDAGGQDLPHYAGHRERLSEKFKISGGTALADYELLELALFRSIPRRDTKPIAKALIDRFGSFSEAVAAPIHLLTEVPGVGESVALDLKLLHAVAGRFTRGTISKKQVLSSFSAVLDYCRVTMGFENKEQFRILFLDKQNGLIADEVQQTGTVDHTPVYPREVVKRALELSAAAIILVHNHPSGDVTPSRADQRMTKTIVEIAQSLGIVVHDHLIIARDAHASFRALNLL